MTALDELQLAAALALAEQAIGLSDPNPRVGCLIGDANGVVFGRGHTLRAGAAHAEIAALADARLAGADIRGATAWVTLEPCAHHGRTPPCCDALINAGVSRVVVATRDPFPAVNGAGIARLRAAGVVVDVAGGAIADRAREINIGFFHRVATGLPWVRLKTASSLDGRTALNNGRSHWITGASARADGHAWRRRAGAVLTGIGTVLADNPRLDVREVATALQPLRVVLDSELRCPVDARVLQAPGNSLVVCSAPASDPSPFGALTEVLSLGNSTGEIDLRAVMAELARRSINEVHIEAGARLNASLLEQNLVDELLMYVAPLLMGPGMPIAALVERHELNTVLRWQLHRCDQLGDDMRLLLRR